MPLPGRLLRMEKEVVHEDDRDLVLGDEENQHGVSGRAGVNRMIKAIPGWK